MFRGRGLSVADHQRTGGPGVLGVLLCVLVCVPFHGQSKQVGGAQERDSAKLRARIEATPKLPFKGVPLMAQPPTPGWVSDAVSWVASDGKGEIYELQRGSEADPVLVLNAEGKVLRSWGRGDFTIPHSLRLDPKGNVWTVDAGSSRVIEYSPLGRKLLSFLVGELPENGSPFHGATDIAFGPNGRLYLTDGYGNARVVEYDAGGRRLKQWGRQGKGPGEFDLPHAIQIGADGTIYVADRENGRIEEFDPSGRYLREIAGLGRIYALKLAGDAVWASVGRFDQAPGSGGGWVLKLDRRTGRLMGHIDVPEARAGHALELMPSGEPVITLGDGLLWFKADAVGVPPGPGCRSTKPAFSPFFSCFRSSSARPGGWQPRGRGRTFPGPGRRTMHGAFRSGRAT